jgi:hypothetical protein
MCIFELGPPPSGSPPLPSRVKDSIKNGNRETENQTPKWAKILAIRSSGSQIVQNAPRVHFQIESFGMERPGGVQRSKSSSSSSTTHRHRQEKRKSLFFFVKSGK